VPHVLRIFARLLHLHPCYFGKKTFHCKQPSLRVISAVSFVACCRNVESEALFSDIDGMLLGLTAELDEMLKLQA